jgi:NADPH-dependent 2,4-dienoyl-CoA reductase/sulfur reductase-like enzyme
MSEADAGPGCVIVGASLAGLRAAEGLRRAGYAGPLTVIGAETDGPYNRPPLSKHRPEGGRPETFRRARILNDVTWLLGDAAVASDLETRTVTLASGRTVPWRALVVATGLTPRRLPLTGPSEGRHVLRTVGDAVALYDHLDRNDRLVVVGAGFVGCEVATTARALGAEVTVVAPDAEPLERALGPQVGAELRRRHEADGVRFRLGVLPVSIDGAERVESVTLSSGEVLPAGVVVEAIGSRPNVEWLDGNGLDLADGALCDGALRVEGRADVFACGDVARFPNALFDDVPRRVEHWTMATDTGRRAGRSAAAYLAGEPVTQHETFAPVPSFWSDQCNTRLQAYGSTALGADDVRVLEGDLRGEVALGYHRDGELVGALMLGLFNRHPHYHEQIAGRRVVQAGIAPGAPDSTAAAVS